MSIIQFHGETWTLYRLKKTTNSMIATTSVAIAATCSDSGASVLSTNWFGAADNCCFVYGTWENMKIDTFEVRKICNKGQVFMAASSYCAIYKMRYSGQQ